MSDDDKRAQLKLPRDSNKEPTEEMETELAEEIAAEALAMSEQEKAQLTAQGILPDDSQAAQAQPPAIDPAMDLALLCGSGGCRWMGHWDSDGHLSALHLPEDEALMGALFRVMQTFSETFGKESITLRHNAWTRAIWSDEAYKQEGILWLNSLVNQALPSCKKICALPGGEELCEGCPHRGRVEAPHELTRGMIIIDRLLQKVKNKKDIDICFQLFISRVRKAYISKSR